MVDVSLTAATHPGIHALLCGALNQTAGAYGEMSIAVGEPALYLSDGTDLVLPDAEPGFVVGGSMEMRGGVSGRAVLLFRPTAARHLLEVLMGPGANGPSAREDTVRIGPHHVTALLEVVTITLSAVCKAIGDYLGHQTERGEPQVLVGYGEAVVQSVLGAVAAGPGHCLVAVMPFASGSQELEGSLAIVLDERSLERLLAGMGAA